MVLKAQHMVVNVVCRSNFQASRSELNVNISVLNHGDNPTYSRHNNVKPLQPGILNVFGINTHGCVAHDGFGACCSYNGIISFAVFVHDVALILARYLYLVFGCHIIFKVVEF